MKLPVVEYNYVSSEDEEAVEERVEQLKAEAIRCGLTPADTKPMAMDGRYHAFVFLLVELPGQPHTCVDFQVAFDQDNRAQNSTSEWLWDATGDVLGRAASSFTSYDRQRMERKRNARGKSGSGEDDVEPLILSKSDPTLSVSDRSIQEKERSKIRIPAPQVRVSVSANLQKAKKSLAQQRSASFTSAPKTMTFDALVAQKLGKEPSAMSSQQRWLSNAESQRQSLDALEPPEAPPVKASGLLSRSSLRKTLGSPRQSIKAASKSQAAVALTKTLKGAKVSSLTRKRLNEVVIECNVRGTKKLERRGSVLDMKIVKGGASDVDWGFSLPLTLFDDGSHSMKNLQFIHRDAHTKEGATKQYALWVFSFLKVCALYVVSCGLTQLNSNYSYEVAIKIIGIPVMINRLFQWLWKQVQTAILVYRVNKVAKEEKRKREEAEKKADAESGVDNSKKRRRKWWMGKGMKAAKLCYWCASNSEEKVSPEQREKDKTEAVVEDLSARGGVELQLQRWAARASTFRQLLKQGQADLPFLNMDNLIEIFLSPIEMPDPDVLNKVLLAVSDLDLSDPKSQEQLDELEKKIDKWVKRICKELGYGKNKNKKKDGHTTKEAKRTPTLGLKWEVVGKVTEVRPSDLGTELIAQEVLAEALQTKLEFSEEGWAALKEALPTPLSADNFIKVGDSYVKPSVPLREKVHDFRQSVTKLDATKGAEGQQPVALDSKEDSPSSKIDRIRQSQTSSKGAKGARKPSTLFPEPAKLGKSPARKPSSKAESSTAQKQDLPLAGPPSPASSDDKSPDVNPDMKTDPVSPQGNMASQLSWMSQQEEAGFSPQNPSASPEQVAVDIPPQAEDPQSSGTPSFLSMGKISSMFARRKRGRGGKSVKGDEGDEGDKGEDKGEGWA